MKRHTSLFPGVEKTQFSSSKHKENRQIALHSSVDIPDAWLVAVRPAQFARRKGTASNTVDPKEGQSDALWYLENVRVRDAKLPGQKGQVAGDSDLATGCASGCRPRCSWERLGTSSRRPLAVAELSPDPRFVCYCFRSQ